MTKLYFIFLLCALTSAGARDVSGLRQGPYVVSGGARQDVGSLARQSDLNQATSYKTDPSGYSDPVASRTYSGVSSPSGSTDSVATRGYSGSRSYIGSSSTNDQDSSVDYSDSTSKSGYSGTNSNSAQTQRQDHSGTTRTLAYTSNDQDHNGLSENEVSELVAAANRRRLQRPFYLTPNRARLVAPKQYGTVLPRYSTNLPYGTSNLYGRSGDDVALDLASGTNTGSSYDAQLRQQDSSLNAGNGYGSSANENNGNREGQQEHNGNSYLTRQSDTNGAKSDSSESAQESLDSSRRFYLPNSYGINPYNPYPTNNNPLDPFADLNTQNYLNAFGAYGK